MRSVLFDVYKQLPVTHWIRFFTRSEETWRNYLQRQDAFTLGAYIQLQEQQRAILNIILSEL